MKSPQEHIDTYEWPKEVDRGQLRIAFRAAQLDALESLKKEAVESLDKAMSNVGTPDNERAIYRQAIQWKLTKG